jgi:hypothetical protein
MNELAAITATNRMARQDFWDTGSTPPAEAGIEEPPSCNKTRFRTRQDFWDTGECAGTADGTSVREAHDQFLPPELALRASWYNGSDALEEQDVPAITGSVP